MFHVVGCHHGIQPGRGGFTAFDGPELNGQREHFRALLEAICAENAIQIVLEEDGDVEETSGNQLADQLTVPWRDINTSNDDKDRMNIPREYVTDHYTYEQKRGWNGQRERFMVDKIREHQPTTESVLIICGFDHLQPLANILGHEGSKVRAWDYRRLGWYRRGVFSEDP